MAFRDNFMMTSSYGNIYRVTGHLCGEFTGPRWIPPHKGQRRGALVFSLICVWMNSWVNNREAGDLRRYRVHYDVTVMLVCTSGTKSWLSNHTNVLHDECHGVSNHQHLDCLLSLLFGHTSNKTSKLISSLAFVRGTHRRPVDFPHKGQ